MTILGFDTATAATAVAVLGPGREAEARDDPAPGERPAHATRLLPLVAQVMAQSGTGWDDLATIAVGVGPGSFTGLRIGVATARALAQARGLPLVGVSTLEVLARAALAEAGERAVLAVIDARRQEAFIAAWHDGRAVLTARAARGDALAREVGALPAGPLAVGDGALRFRAHLEAAGALVPEDESPLHRVSARQLCRLADAGRADQPAAVLPDYLRPPDAEVTRKRT